MNMIRHNDVPSQPATFSPCAMRLSAARAIPNSPESPSGLSCRRLRIQLSVHRADRGHPNESDVCDRSLPYVGGTTAVSSLNLSRYCPNIWDGTAPVPPTDFVILPHICSIMLSPNCEHLISVAPSIKRAKS